VLGNPVRRREDPHLVTGRGRYVDDVRLERALFAAFLRSPLAHARVVRVDTTPADALPGVRQPADLEPPGLRPADRQRAAQVRDVKGIGESGNIGSTAAVHNAVLDALGHLGVRHLDMPLTPGKVWWAIRDSAQ